VSGADDLAGMIQQLNELLEPIMEASVGYRAKAANAGFNEAASNAMAASYHDVLMTIMRNKAFGNPT
jgi:hypothetical protein